MALINIEYGSLASSDTMNKNFMYLDDKIADTSDSIMTSISSILSNIATINSRLNEITNNVSDSFESLSSTINDYKTKTKLLVNVASMVPDWKNCISVSITTDTKYVVPSNGYLLLLPNASVKGNLLINNVAVVFKNRANSYDNSAQLVAFPVAENDEVISDVTFENVYFLPNKEVSLAGF
ncbi:hypothetical protein IJ384_06520 [bacterium]|nr:hypothetical protein [bacterium]